MLGRWGFIAVSLALTVSVPMFASRASAQEESSDDAARRHFRLGQAHYENGEFAEAATEFDEAFRLSQRPQLLYNVYVAYRDAGDMPNAARALRMYLDQVPDADNASQLRARLVAMERVLASSATTTTTTTTSTDTGTATTDTTTTDTTATDTTDSSTSASTSTSTIDTTSETETASSSSGGGFGSSPVGWIVGGVGAAMLIAGIVTGVMALDSQSTLDQQCGADHHSCPAGFESTRNTGQALGAATDGLLITGGVALATGVVLLFVLDGGSSSDAQSAPPVTASCGPTGCSAFVNGTF